MTRTGEMGKQVMLREEDTLLKRLFPWYWPASEERCLAAESAILHDLTYERRLVETSSGLINTLEFGGHLQGSDVQHLNKTMVMLPGFGAAAGLFYKNFEAFASQPGLKVYGVDWLGTGRSSRVPFEIKPGAEGSVEAAETFFIEALEEWREKENIDKMILFGHSLGGYLSAAYAIKYPERVEHLFMVSPAGIPRPTANDMERFEKFRQRSPLFFSAIQYFWSRNFTPQGFIRFLGPLGPSLVRMYTDRRFPEIVGEEAKVLRDYVYQFNARRGSGEYGMHCLLSFGAWAREPLIDRVHMIKAPTTFLYGTHDWMDSNAGRQAAAKIQAPASVNLIHDAGHQLFLENPHDFNETVLAVVRKIQQGRL